MLSKFIRSNPLFLNNYYSFHLRISQGATALSWTAVKSCILYYLFLCVYSFFLFFSRIYLFLIGWQWLYHIVLVSASTWVSIGVPMSPPSWISLPPLPTPLGCHRAPVWGPWVIQQIPTGCLTYGNMYVSYFYSLCFHLILLPAAEESIPECMYA